MLALTKPNPLPSRSRTKGHAQTINLEEPRPAAAPRHARLVGLETRSSPFPALRFVGDDHMTGGPARRRWKGPLPRARGAGTRAAAAAVLAGRSALRVVLLVLLTMAPFLRAFPRRAGRLLLPSSHPQRQRARAATRTATTTTALLLGPSVHAHHGSACRQWAALSSLRRSRTASLLSSSPPPPASAVAALASRGASTVATAASSSSASDAHPAEWLLQGAQAVKGVSELID